MLYREHVCLSGSGNPERGDLRLQDPRQSVLFWLTARFLEGDFDDEAQSTACVGDSTAARTVYCTNTTVSRTRKRTMRCLIENVLLLLLLFSPAAISAFFLFCFPSP